PPWPPPAPVSSSLRRGDEGPAGRYGYYEAIDYTPAHLPEGRRSLVVRCFMAHHQGMSLVALANALLGNPMQRRFHAEPMVRATELLLQERVPAVVRVVPRQDESLPVHLAAETTSPPSRRRTPPQTPRPRAPLTSNSSFTTLLTNAGAGFSSCQGRAVTRWREDASRDCWGLFFYIRDLRSGLVWSAGYQPVCRAPDDYEVTFSADKAEIRRIDAGVETRMEVTVSPEKCAEIRRLTLTNHNSRPVELEVTSYAEVVLAPHGADVAHPAFHKL